MTPEIEERLRASIRATLLEVDSDLRRLPRFLRDREIARFGSRIVQEAIAAAVAEEDELPPAEIGRAVSDVRAFASKVFEEETGVSSLDPAVSSSST